jgi:predicted aldo/keto reductase-like oxidoreductase
LKKNTNETVTMTTSRDGIPYRTLGHTGEAVSIAGLGGWHIGVQETEQESIALIRTALDNGINFMDNSWDYNEGVSEIRMGKALKDGYRDKAFLMTKIDGQTRKSANEQLDECFSRLDVDMIDLVQFHEIVRLEDPDRVFAPGGAIEALLEAKKTGKIRYIGFTGHKSPEIHLKMLKAADDYGFLFDTVQMPLSIMDAHYDSFQKLVLPILNQKNIGSIAMKTLCGGHIFKCEGVTAEECLHYSMSLPVSTVVTGCQDMERVQQMIAAARSFKPMSQEQVSTLKAKTAGSGVTGDLEPFKTGTDYDATTTNPHWLG